MGRDSAACLLPRQRDRVPSAQGERQGAAQVKALLDHLPGDRVQPPRICGNQFTVFQAALPHIDRNNCNARTGAKLT